MKKIFILSNDSSYTFSLRKELILEFIKKGFKVVVVCPNGRAVSKLLLLGATHVDWKLNSNSINPILELYSFFNLSSIIKAQKPSHILSFTIKPNIYSGLLKFRYNFIHIPNITGLGKIFANNNVLKKLIIFLYKLSFKNSKVIFLQNSIDYSLFKQLNIFPSKLVLIPGSGVNIEEYNFHDYPSEKNGINFLYLGRIMKKKGIDLYLDAAKQIKEKYKKINFIISGPLELGYEKKIKSAISEHIVTYKGNLIDVKDVIIHSHALIQPSFYPEGISNVILEASSIGRPVITSNNVGCGEAIIDNITGFVFQKKNVEDLVKKIELFITLSQSKKTKLSFNAREHVKNVYNRNIVVNAYLSKI
jgi:glycosyltransferase involved in cell wall biosynthesis